MNWISVKDELPNGVENVIFYDGYEILIGCRTVHPQGFCEWYLPTGHKNPHNPTHWMPLPEPPK